MDVTLHALPKTTKCDPMPTTQYTVNSRQLSTFSPILDELNLEPHKNYLFDLSYLACIDVIGDRGNEFLQGQLSCDLRDVTSNQMRQGAMCNLKGRVLALLDVIDWNGLHLIVPGDLLKETQASLAKTAAFSQVTLSPSTTRQLFGFYLKNRDDMIPFNAPLPDELHGVVHNDMFCSYHLGGGYYIFLVNTTHAADICSSFIKQSQWRGALAWHSLQLHQNRLEIYPQSRGLFLPHRLGLQLSGYLSFNKGCYKGQEIVARTHYRAKLKHEMKVFTIQTGEPLQSGQRLLNQNDNTEMGELIDFCPINEKTFLIAASVIFDCPSSFRIEGHVA